MQARTTDVLKAGNTLSAIYQEDSIPDSIYDVHLIYTYHGMQLQEKTEQSTCIKQVKLFSREAAAKG